MAFSECHYADCRYAEDRYADCHYSECRYAKCRCSILCWNAYSAIAWNASHSSIDYMTVLKETLLIMTLFVTLINATLHMFFT